MTHHFLDVKKEDCIVNVSQTLPRTVLPTSQSQTHDGANHTSVFRRYRAKSTRGTLFADGQIHPLALTPIGHSALIADDPALFA